MTDKDGPLPKIKYPNAFLFGLVTGSTLQLVIRGGTMEPLSARPFSYLRVGLFFGVAFHWWDYCRRVALEDVMRGEQRGRYYETVRAMNTSVRIGEEDEISNLTDYLAGSSLRH